jgi:hypothetical protein
MTISSKTQSTRQEPKGSALMQKMQELSRRTQSHFGTEPISQVRLAPKNQPPAQTCGCSCSCC